MSWFGIETQPPAKVAGEVQISNKSESDEGKVIGNNDTSPPRTVTGWFRR